MAGVADHEMTEWDALAIRLDRVEAKVDRIRSVIDRADAILEGMSSNPMFRMMAKRMQQNGEEPGTIPAGDSLPGGTQ